MDSYGLSCSNLLLKAGGREVLRELTFHVPAGETCAVIGESGAGKTTLLRAIAGFLQPSSGTISIDGRDVAALKPKDRQATLLFQEPRLFPALSVADNVSFALRVRGVGKEGRHAAALDLLAEVGLADRASDAIEGLSGGEQQRVALARALCVAPSVLLLDEPFSAVDAPRRVDLRNVVRELLTNRPTTTVFVSHDVNDAALMADSLAVLVDGRIVQHDTVANVVGQPTSAAVERLTTGAR